MDGYGGFSNGKFFDYCHNILPPLFDIERALKWLQADAKKASLLEPCRSEAAYILRIIKELCCLQFKYRISEGILLEETHVIAHFVMRFYTAGTLDHRFLFLFR